MNRIKAGDFVKCIRVDRTVEGYLSIDKVYKVTVGEYLMDGEIVNPTTNDTLITIVDDHGLEGGFRTSRFVKVDEPKVEFVRPTIVVKQDESESIDIKNESGELLMRLNVFNHASGFPSVDVIFSLDKLTTCQVASWNRGLPVLSKIVTGGLVSVSKKPSEI